MDRVVAAALSNDGSTCTSLLDRVRARDGPAWRRLVQLYGSLIYHWCVESSLSSEDAADVAQEVFRSVATGIADFHHDREQDTFRGWLRTITLNKIRDLARHRARQPRAVGGTEHQIFLTGLADAEPSQERDDRGTQNVLYRRALDLIQGDFEERTWRAFWLTVVEEQSPDAAAAALAMSPAAVRKAKSRVLRRLREELHAEEA